MSAVTNYSQTHLQRQLLALLLVFVSLAASTTLSARGLAQKPEGEVRIMARHTSTFDQYTRNPTESAKAWMRDHYERMEVYSSYFDSRLSWFPNTWVYKDLYGIKPGWTVTQQNPNWILKDRNGNSLYIPFECSGGVCTQYAADFGNPAFRSWWINTARDLINRGYPGLTIDDVNFTWRVSDGYGNHVTPIDPRTGQEMTLTNWRRYMAEFLEQIRAAFPNTEILHNMVWFAAPSTDPHLQRAVAAADIIHLERGGSDAGLRGGSLTNGQWGFQTFMRFVDAMHAQGKGVALRDSGTNTTLREFGLATWLLLSKGKDIYGVDINSWIVPNSYWDGFDTNLGTAQENWLRQSNGLLRRKFSCGVVYLNQPEQPATYQALDATMTRLNGSAVNGITLQPRTAAILKQQNCSTTPPPPVNPPSNNSTENLTTWRAINGIQVTSLGGSRYRLTHPGRNWPILAKTIPSLPAGATIRVSLSASSNPANAEFRIDPWSLASSGGGHIRLNSSSNTYERTFTNNSGSALSNVELRFYFANSQSSGAGQTITVENLVIDTPTSTSTSTVPTTTIRQDILGSQVNTPLSIYGTANASAGVDFVWGAVHDINRDQWWTGSAWQTGYTRFRVPTANSGATQSNWSFWFNPGRTGSFQAFARAIDLNGNHDPTDHQVWFWN